MPTLLVLDSNTSSYYFRGDPQVVPRLQALRPADIGVPAIVEYALRHGLLRLPPVAAIPRLAALEQLLRPMRLLPFDSECAGVLPRDGFAVAELEPRCMMVLKRSQTPYHWEWSAPPRKNSCRSG